MALACHACLSRNAEELRHQAEGLRAELAEVAAAFEGVRGRADALTHEVVGEVRCGQRAGGGGAGVECGQRAGGLRRGVCEREHRRGVVVLEKGPHAERGDQEGEA